MQARLPVMRARWRFLHPLTFLLSAVCMVVCFEAEANVYFEENFAQYTEQISRVNPALDAGLGNDPIWNQEFDVTVPAKTGGMFWTAFQPSPPPQDVAAYDVGFSFRYQSDDAKQVRAVIRMARGGDIVVDIFGDRVAVSVPGRDRVEAALETRLPRNLWMACVVRAADGELRVALRTDRLFKEVLAAKVPAHTFAGINFEVLEGAPFALTDVFVRDPAPLPDYGVERLLSVPQKVDEAAFKRGGRHAVPVADRCGAMLRIGEGKDTAALVLEWADGTQTRATFGTAGAKSKRREFQDGKVAMVETEMPDALIRITGLQEKPKTFNVRVRPLMRNYMAGGDAGYRFHGEYHDILREWDRLPSAAAHPLRVEAFRTAAGTELWLDGKLAISYAGKTLKGFMFELTEAASIGGITSEKAMFETMRYLPLDISALGKAKAFAAAKTSLKPGFGKVKGVPMMVADGAGSGDVGLVHGGQGNWGLEVDEYLRRSPFDGFLGELHFSIPGGVPYTRAWVLCAVDPDPAKDPILTARLASFTWDGAGNNRLADTTINLGVRGAGATKVGTVSTAAGGVPLWLVEVPLNSGEILDIMMDEPQLTFEFLGKPWENFQQLDNSKKPDPRSTSAVQIFGVTLEKSPVALAFEQSQPANVFHNDEKPETTAVLSARGVASGRLVWEITDVSGGRVNGGSAKYEFAAAGAEQRVVIPLETQDLGWFGLNVRLEDGTGRVAFEHSAAFARLDRDTRKAHYDSPFGIWWFCGAHNTPSALDFCGPVLEKAGIRCIAWAGGKQEEWDKYRIFRDQINMPFRFGDFGKTPEALAAEAANPGAVTEKVYAEKKEKFDKELAKTPHVREVLIFHESGPGNDVPPEVLGLPFKRPADVVRNHKRYADTVNLAGAFLRKYYPHLKTVLGNGNCSASNVAAVFRNGGKQEFIDFIGNESAAQSFIPEKLQEFGIQGHHIAMDTAKALTGRRIPATGCYEFTYRAERSIGELQQAEWYARDVLISLAHNYTRVGPGILMDAQNAYYNTLWGASGLMRRGPTAYPKPAYVAYAVLTDVLDQAAFSRQIPTGSKTVYAVEFKRADGRLVTALWASRGDAEFALDFGVNAEAECVTMFGARERRAAADGKLTVKAGTSPAYVLSTTPVASAAIAKRVFPKDERRIGSSKVVADFAAAGLEVTDDSSLDTPLDKELKLAVRKAGDFRVAPVQDDARGACVELTLQTARTPELNKYFTEYAVLKLKEPVEVPGRPVGFGATVKGNSNWGRVMYMLEDAKGEVWRSIGTGSWSVDALDWPGNAAVNFDGWNMVALPLAETSLFNDRSPGPVLEQWVSGGGDKTVDFPVKLTGLIIEMNRHPLELIDFTTVNPAIRLKDVRALYEPTPTDTKNAKKL